MPQVVPLTSDRNPFLIPEDVLHIAHVSDLHYAPAGVQNRDEAPIGSGATDPDVRLRAALTAIPGTVHPLGGFVRKPDITIVNGDNVHEASESTARFEAAYPVDESLEVDGNHDHNDVRDMIVRRRGSLNWGRKIKHVFFQALTERYVSSVDNGPPTVAQLQAVTAILAARPSKELTVIVVHRSMTGGYAAEWDRTARTTLTAAITTGGQATVTVASAAGLSVGKRVQIDAEEVEITNINGLTITMARGQSNTVAATHSNGATVYDTSALDALQVLCQVRRVVCILNGHDHQARNETWRGYRVHSPGSVTQSPMPNGPYGSIYSESFNLLRIGHDFYDVANYNFGYDGTQVNPRNWNPGTWNWSSRFMLV